jgi:outer membrane protein assembly factor BamB
MNGLSSIKFLACSIIFSALTLLPPSMDVAQGQQHDAQSAPANWARWRGPAGNGISTNQHPVTSWSETENVIWRTRVPGKGHASPIVTDSKIFLATADQSTQTQSVVAFDRETGKQIWNTIVNTGGFPDEIHVKNTHASSTIALGDGLIYVVFFNNEQKRIAALDLDGEVVWRDIVGDYRSPYAFGIGASPIVYQSLVIVPTENMNEGALVAYDGKTGERKWSASRPSINYSTPVVANVGGKDQLLISGIDKVASYDPLTGKENWTTPAKWKATCGTMVWNESTVFASGGYPGPQTLAIAADGSGEMLWEKPLKCYEQSMIVVDGFLYGITDKGVIFCFDAADGTEKWKQRFKGPVSASPVFANGMLYFTAENGQTMVIKANPNQFEKVATNQLGTSGFASFALADNKIYTRVGDKKGGYQEWLYCIGKP